MRTWLTICYCCENYLVVVPAKLFYSLAIIHGMSVTVLLGEAVVAGLVRCLCDKAAMFGDMIERTPVLYHVSE